MRQSEFLTDMLTISLYLICSTKCSIKSKYKHIEFKSLIDFTTDVKIFLITGSLNKI